MHKKNSETCLQKNKTKLLLELENGPTKLTTLVTTMSINILQN